MNTAQDETTLPALEEMNAEQFLGWMLENCAMDEAEKKGAKILAKDFILLRLVESCFNIQEVSAKYPNLYGWLLTQRRTA